MLFGGKKYAAVVVLAGCLGGLCPESAHAEPKIDTRYNSYGYPGLIDMPAAHSRPDGELAFSSSYFAGQLRNTLTFQMLPRLSGSFRYAALQDVRINPGGVIENSRFDRSFSLHFRFADEAHWRPAMAVGLNDFLGTGIYSSEYVVATKTFGDRVRVTGGIGWGRLAGVGGFRNPLSLLLPDLDGRSGRTASFGGRVNSDQLFSGDAALFGGLQWQATDKLTLTAEYSSDANPSEVPSAFDRDIPLNFGAAYQVRPGVSVAGRWLYGSELGVQLTMALNPKTPKSGSGSDPAPPPVVPRTGDLGWGTQAQDGPALRGQVARALEGQGIGLHGFVIEGDTARLEIENKTYSRNAQAIGRTARSLTGVLPPRIERFVIAPVTNGVPGAQVEIARGDLEALEHDLQNTWQSYKRARITPADGTIPVRPGRYPEFDWSLKPYLTPSFFDPDDPVRADFGAEIKARFEPVRGLEFSGTVRKKVVGNLDDSTRPSDSVLPRVRSEFNIYDREGDPAITNLSGAYFFKPGRNLYGRVSAGYLEQMFGGVSGEILWKPVDSPFAIGVEANYVQQRDFDQLWGFRDYGVATGHVSAYWDLGNGFHTQVDVGRYLAKDWGATLTVDREFENGWRVGAFATLTDVPFSRFGEGSFDKGIRITIPISWISGQPTRDDYTTTIRPVTRDGGARLDVEGRLYDRVRPLHKPELSDGWGRFWR